MKSPSNNWGAVGTRAGIFTGMLVLAFVVSAPKAQAESETVRVAREAVSDSLADSKDPALTPEERFLRLKTLLKNVLELSAAQTTDVQAELATIDEAADDLATLRRTFNEHIDTYLDYFEALATVVDRTETLEGIQSIAGDFRDWREAKYNPRMKEIFDFTSAFRVRRAITIAEQRVVKINTDVRRAKIRSSEMLTSRLNQAAASVRDARDLNRQALDLLLNYLPQEKRSLTADQTTDTTRSTSDKRVAGADATPEVTATSTLDADRTFQRPTIESVNRAAVERLKDAYRYLIEASDIIKRAVR